MMEAHGGEIESTFLLLLRLLNLEAQSLLKKESVTEISKKDKKRRKKN